LAEYPEAELVSGCRRAVEEQGWRAIKVKIGHPDPLCDLERLKAVREAVGPTIRVMVDVNGMWDLPRALQYGRRLAEHDIAWIEEPLWYDDVQGHARLAEGSPLRSPWANSFIPLTPSGSSSTAMLCTTPNRTPCA